jgi:hypothetical protein
MITSGKGRYKVWLKRIDIGDDIVFLLGGGEQSHIGSIIIQEPEKDLQVIKFEGHKDHIVLKHIAMEAYKKYHKKIIVLGGIHIQRATKEDINNIVCNCQDLIKKI